MKRHQHSVKSPMVNDEKMRPSHRLRSVLCVPFSALTLLVGDRKDIRPVHSLCHLSTKILFQNKWRKKTQSTRFTWNTEVVRYLGTE